MRRIKINSDNFEDCGKIYRVISERRNSDTSTGVSLVLADDDANIIKKVVPSHWIEEVEEE